MSDAERDEIVHAPGGPASRLSLDTLEPGHYVCCVYGTEQEHRAVLTPFLLRGLERNEKVMYIVDDHSPETVLGYMRDAGVDPDPYRGRGQLVIRTRDDVYAQGGVFDPDRVISLLRQEARRALDEGYAALRITGEMTWALRGTPGSHRLVEYLARLNEHIPAMRCLALCQFDRRRFEPSVLLDVLRTHPIAVLNAEVYENIYYVPPGAMLGPDFFQATLRQWEAQLARCRASEKAATRAARQWQTMFDALREAICILDDDGRIVRCNRAAAEWLGRSPAEVCGRLCHELVHGTPSPRPDCPLERARRSRRREVGEMRIADRWYEVTVDPILDENGEFNGAVHAVCDITARKRAEEADRAFAQLAERLAACTGVHDTVAAVREITEPLLGWDAFYFAWRRAGEDVFRVLFFVDTIDGEKRVFPAEDWSFDEISEPLRPLLDGTPVLINRASGESGPAFCRFGDTSRPSASLLFAPVRSARGVIGILSVQSYTPFRYDEGHLHFLLGVADRIGPTLERACAEEALREALQFNREIISNAMEGIVVCDRDLRFVAWNRFMEGLTGIPADRVLGRHALEVFPFLCEQGAEKALRAALAGEVVSSGDLPYRLPETGRQGWAQMTCGPHRNAAGEIVGVIVLVRDVTARRRSEEERDRILNLSRDLICVASADGYFKYVNPAWERVLGYTREELLSRPFLDFIHPDDHRKNDEEVARLQSGLPSVEFENRYIHKDGSVRTIEWTAEPLPDRGLMYCVGRDVTARRKAEAEARARQAELAHVSRLNMMGELASGLAHELNQPLSTILCGMELCRRLVTASVPNVGELAETMQVVADEAERAGEIIRRLRRFVSKREIQRSTVDINEVVRESVEIVGPDASRHHVRFRLDLTEPVPLIQADPVQLEQVLVNLFRNAIDAMDDPAITERVVAIRTHTRDDGMIEVAVEDTGKGASAEAVARMFEPFFTTKAEGMGIGLAISRSIVEAHGGRLWAEPGPERGMIFRFTLPCRQEAVHDAMRADGVCGG